MCKNNKSSNFRDTTINVLKRMTVLDEDMSECCSSEISYFIDEVKLLHISKRKNILHNSKNWKMCLFTVHLQINEI